MIVRPKRLPRLWCALQGLLPLDECLAAQRAELAWPGNLPVSERDSAPTKRTPSRHQPRRKR